MTRPGAGDFREAAMNVKIVVHAVEEVGFWAEVPALSGCVSQGETMDELLANMRELDLLRYQLLLCTYEFPPDLLRPTLCTDICRQPL
jgi:hypothetical protein